MIEAQVTFTPGPPKRILDFDVETVAAGFADPQWVPNRVTAIAWSWLGEDVVSVRTILDYAKNLTTFLEAYFLGCKPMLREFVETYNQADVVTGHNIGRFDLGVMNAELMRLGLPLLEEKPTIDTMRLGGEAPLKGFKKGQDVMAVLFDVPAEKKPMNWAQWQRAYAQVGWGDIRERVAGDVVQHKLLFARLQEQGYLS